MHVNGVRLIMLMERIELKGNSGFVWGGNIDGVFTIDLVAVGRWKRAETIWINMSSRDRDVGPPPRTQTSAPALLFATEISCLPFSALFYSLYFAHDLTAKTSSFTKRYHLLCRFFVAIVHTILYLLCVR